MKFWQKASTFKLLIETKKNKNKKWTLIQNNEVMLTEINHRESSFSSV